MDSAKHFQKNFLVLDFCDWHFGNSIFVPSIEERISIQGSGLLGAVRGKNLQKIMGIPTYWEWHQSIETFDCVPLSAPG
jgi:hypothetical protein